MSQSSTVFGRFALLCSAALLCSFVCSFVVGGLILAPRAIASDADDAVAPTLAAAEHNYHQSNFNGAIRVLDDLLAIEEQPQEQRIEALQLLASCRQATGDGDGARATVAQILDLDSGYTMDPDAVPPPLVKTYYQLLSERKQLKYADGLETVAILDLKNHSITDHESMAALGQGLADALITSISGASKVRVVERERIAYIRGEIGMNQSAEFDQQNAVQAGKLLGAQSFVLGGFTRMKKDIRIDARVVRTETGEVLKTESVDGKLNDIFELVDELAQKIVTALGEVKQLPRTEKDTTFDALVEYSKGLERLDAGELKEAYEHFERSRKAAPGFTKASRRVRQIEPLLALLTDTGNL